MKCPDCETLLKCGCETCVKLDNHADDPAKRMIRLADGEACPSCGVVRSSEAWADIEWTQYKETSEEVK